MAPTPPNPDAAAAEEAAVTRRRGVVSMVSSCKPLKEFES
jgi:hypothetical protein